jgi:hypothetical protein
MCQTKTKTTPAARIVRPKTTTTPKTTETRHDANANDDGGIDEGHGTDHCTSSVLRVVLAVRVVACTCMYLHVLACSACTCMYRLY